MPLHTPSSAIIHVVYTNILPPHTPSSADISSSPGESHTPTCNMFTKLVSYTWSLVGLKVCFWECEMCYTTITVHTKHQASNTAVPGALLFMHLQLPTPGRSHVTLN
jgi:hypothetical protein